MNDQIRRVLKAVAPFATPAALLLLALTQVPEMVQIQRENRCHKSLYEESSYKKAGIPIYDSDVMRMLKAWCN